MKTTAFTLLAAVAAAMLASCGPDRDYDATGIFESTVVTVPAETAGKILAINAEEGDTVALGDELALVDTTLMSLQLMQLESQKSSVAASAPDVSLQVAELRTQIAHQSGEVERIGRLLADGAATQKHKDDAEAQLHSMRGRLDAMLSSLGKNRSSVADNALALQYQAEQLREQIDRSRVKSPIGGTVLQKLAEAGEYASPGKPLLRIANLDDIYLRCYFTAEQLADVNLGREVTVIADFGGDKRFEYPGTVVWIAAESEFTPKSIQTADSRSNLVYAAKVAVRNDGRLKLGQYGEVKL